MKVGGATLIALVVAGTAAASGVNSTQWTPREMRAGVKALGYPKLHPKRVACRGLGTASAGLFSSFRCNAMYPHHRHRRFIVMAGTEGGWVCAGRRLSGCRVLARGFVGSSQVTRWGGLEATAGYSATGYVQEHYNNVPPETGSPCTAVGGTTRFMCPYSSPAVTVTVTYKQVKGGWLVAGSG